MAFKFGRNLRDRTIEYFQKYHNLTISEDQADEYLDSLASLYLSFNSLPKKRIFPVREKPSFFNSYT